jgi:hypothetical protein
MWLRVVGAASGSHAPLAAVAGQAQRVWSAECKVPTIDFEP